MAQTATIYSLSIELADVDRGVYGTLDLRVARQPAETLEYMWMRVLAYCLEYADGIAFTEGVAAGNEAGVVIRDLTGRLTAWIEVGAPSAERLHRGHKLAGRAAVYTHRDVRKLLAQLAVGKVHRAEDIPIYEFDREFVDAACALLERRSALALSITERVLYLGIAGQTLTTTIVEHRIPAAA